MPLNPFQPGGQESPFGTQPASPAPQTPSERPRPASPPRQPNQQPQTFGTPAPAAPVVATPPPPPVAPQPPHVEQPPQPVPLESDAADLSSPAIMPDDEGPATAPGSRPRGIRNNNPFNIKKSRVEWRGTADEQSDPTFVQFSTAEDGIRAGVRLLHNYQYRHGLNTVRKFMRRFAPSTENDTGAYVDFIAKQAGIDPDEPFKVSNQDLMKRLARAIINYENGEFPYDDETFERGFQRGVPRSRLG